MKLTQHQYLANKGALFKNTFFFISTNLKILSVKLIRQIYQEGNEMANRMSNLVHGKNCHMVSHVILFYPYKIIKISTITKGGVQFRVQRWPKIYLVYCSCGIQHGVLASETKLLKKSKFFSRSVHKLFLLMSI